MPLRPGWRVDAPFVYKHDELNVLVQRDLYGLWWVFLLDDKGTAVNGSAAHTEGYTKLPAAMAWGEAWARQRMGR